MSCLAKPVPEDSPLSYFLTAELDIELRPWEFQGRNLVWINDQKKIQRLVESIIEMTISDVEDEEITPIDFELGTSVTGHK
jgi:hypothetical protein